MADDPQSVAERFAAKARSFCSVVKSAGTASVEVFLREIHLALAELYTTAIGLPLVAPDNEDAIEGSMSGDDWDALYASLTAFLGKSDRYWKVFDPYNLEKPVRGSLSDDLADIYRDVSRGLDLVESGGSINEALWVWRFEFWSHWSDHAADALRALTRAARRTDV